MMPVHLLAKGVNSDSLIFKPISNIDELPEKAVICQGQDSLGFLWFGTYNGLVRYDGYHFKDYSNIPGDSTSISGNIIASLWCDSGRYLWVGTRANGLNRYDYKTGIFKHYIHNLKDTNSISNNEINSIYKDNEGNLWLGTINGFDLLEPGAHKFQHFLTVNDENTNKLSVFAIFKDHHNRLWVGTAKGLLVYTKSRKTDTYIESEVPGNITIIAPVWKIFEDSYNNIWIGTGAISKRGQGLYKYDIDHNKWHYYTYDSHDPHSISSNRITSFCETRDGAMWIGTDNGLNLYQKASDNFYRYIHSNNRKKSIPFNYIDSIYQSRSGILWFTFHLDGICKAFINHNLFHNYPYLTNGKNDLPRNLVYELYPDRSGYIWVGTADNGLDRFNPVTQKFKHYSYIENSPDSLGGPNVFSAIQDTSGYIWFGNYGKGVSRYDPVHHIFKRYRPGKSGLISGYVICLYIDREQRLWAGTLYNGLFIYNKKKDRFIPFAKVFNTDLNFINQGIPSMFEDAKGMYWIGTVRKGLIRFNSKDDSYITYNASKNTKHRLSNNFVYAILKDKKGVLWAGTQNGLNLYNPHKDSFDRFKMNDQLSNLQINGIVEDHRGNLWVSASKEIIKIDTDRKNIVIYTENDGLDQNELLPLAACISSKGIIYFGGEKGFVSFNPDEIKENRYEPPVAITQINVLNRPFKTKSTYPYVSNIKLPYRDNSITFEFTSLDYHDPSNNEYAYRLKGFNDKWMNIKNRRYATFTNLYPGHYVLQVRGSNNIGVWNSNGTTLSIDILPPFWMTWWFKLIITLLVFSGLGLLIRYISTRKLKLQVQQIERKMALRDEREKTRSVIARDLHDEVASTLGSISLYSEMLKQNIKNSHRTTDFVQKIERLCNEAVDTMNDIVWYVAPRHDTINHLFMRIRNLISDLSVTESIHFRMDIRDPEEDDYISDQTRRNIYLICKEALHNILKHSHAKNVTVCARYKKKKIMIVISDDGEGIKEAEIKGLRKFNMDDPASSKNLTGHGLYNMKYRANEINASLLFRSGSGKDTTICCSLRIT